MTKEKYMALADFQSLWTSTIKPWIVAGFIAVTAVESGATPKLVLQDGTLIEQSTFQPAGDYIEALGSSATGHDNLLLADGTNIAQSTFILSTAAGANNGVATLGADGKVPSSQLPSYVDDVIEAANFAALPAQGEAGKIYVTLDDNKTYRWGGSAYAEISASIALGETQGTAYEGSKGKANADAIAALQTDKANKSEMAIEAVQGDATKKEITLKTGLSQEVLVAHQDISGKADKIAAVAFSTDDSYTVGDYVTYGGNIYKCTTAHAAGAWNAEDFTLVTNNFLAIDGNGNAKDSGKNATDFATAAQGGKADSAIQGVKVNGTALTPDSSNVVDIEMPERVTSEDLATFVV